MRATRASSLRVERAASLTESGSRGRADLHIHTTFSDGWPGPVEVVRRGRRLGLDVIAVTDHDTIEGALWAADYSGRAGAGPEVIVGEEVSTRQGHVVGLFLERRVRPGQSPAATIAAIHEQGGIAFAAHPFWRTPSQARGRRVHGVGWLAADLDFDAIEVENSTPGFGLFNQMAVRLNQDVGLAPLGNSDAHILDAIGRSYTSFPGQTAAAFRQAIEERRTQAHRLRYPALALMRYAAWGLEHRRQRRLASARRSA
ncbi:MAG: phosphotransferase [Candidatus Nephthysia bennettiae]|uniref:PHP domain-containing protein n=1 Tax=Candidatus Nephthysia bennettiae TaxID=3127016 RepID=A0A934K689_9BACT|nr:PHP domain-containing protein [Candidatus Dormibacteraeota bacterium]MBJ7614170.1 PHP domain-containing protein [Candidatus Dormibacteraeota bacterium]PZR98164.1 MAG: phosphotransferase [Candidatus Dormibacteraeota bacterium]